MWGAVTNTGYDGMPTSLGTVRTLIHCLGQGSMTDKPSTFRCTSMSVADIKDCANNLIDLPTGRRGERVVVKEKGVRDNE